MVTKMRKKGKAYIYRNLKQRQFSGLDMIRFARYAANQSFSTSAATGMLTMWFDGPCGDRGYTIWSEK
jgi:hypothetical protein